MLKNFSIILLAIIYVSLASCQQKENNLNFVSINKDSCAKWNLPDLNLTLYIPKEYQLTYNSSGGFYFQAHKFNNKHKIVSVLIISIKMNNEALDTTPHIVHCRQSAFSGVSSF